MSFNKAGVAWIAATAIAVAAPLLRAATDVPGANPGKVAGHVPAQKEQAQSAPTDTTESPPSSQWWSPGDGRTLPAQASYRDSVGEVGVLNSSGEVPTRGHPFFEPIG